MSSALADELSIQVRLDGITDNTLRQEMQGLSDLANGGKSYTSFAAVRRAAEKDASGITDALVSKGYYAASVTPVFDRTDGNISVVFEVSPRNRFMISRYIIQYTDKNLAERARSFREANIVTDGNSDGRTLETLKSQFVSYLRENGYPKARSPGHYVQANFSKESAIAIFEIESGPRAVFGDVDIAGTEETDSDFLKQYLTWEPGTLYQRQKTVAYRDALIETGLFNEVSVVPGETDEAGQTNIQVNVTERKRRTVGAGVSFATDVGAGGQLFWENRNLLGRADKLSAQLQASAVEQKLEFIIARPYPGLPGALSGSLSASNEVSDAFEAQSVELGAALSKFWFDRKLEVSGGLGLNYSQIEDSGVTDAFFYVTAPGIVKWNNDDDVLNPTRGYRASLSVTPFVGDVNFVQAKISAATRRAFGKDKNFILAGRGAIGTSFGIERDSIPATERFFAGGGGSVRGFAFQEAGPLDANLDPVGGASILELNLEARLRTSDNIQLAAFIDGGTVSENDVPSFSEEAFVGAGLGLRYMTPIGPFRVDIATPLNPRPTDDSVQFYFALGQPF